MKRTQRKFSYVEGQQFEHLTFIRLAPSGYRGISKSECKCICGRTVIVRTRMLGRGAKSCGCQNPRSRTHAMTGTPEYQAYQHAKHRCTNPNNKRYADYGGRGIEFRFESFKQWLDELGLRPSNTHSVDRKNVNGHYEPGNIRWTTKHEQRVNQRLEARVAELEQQLANCRGQHAH